jgi:hypothetical protein
MPEYELSYSGLELSINFVNDFFPQTDPFCPASSSYR